MFANYTTLKCSCRLTLLTGLVLCRGRAAALAVAAVVTATTVLATIAAAVAAFATATGTAAMAVAAVTTAVAAATIAAVAVTVAVVAAVAAAAAAATVAVLADVRHAWRRRVTTTVAAGTHVALTLLTCVAPSRGEEEGKIGPAVRETAVEDGLRGGHQMHEVAVAAARALAFFVLTASEGRGNRRKPTWLRGNQ